MNQPTLAHTLSQGVQSLPFVADMVAPTTDGGVGTQTSYLRKTFSVPAGRGAVTLRISALGLYRAFLNGRRIGDDLLTPGWTSYWDRLSYQTYDVTDLLADGENTIDIWLGDGWYRSRMMWPRNEVINTWGDRIAAIAEMRTEAGDILLATDATWQSGLTPVLKSGIYFGEIYDARSESLPVTGSATVLGRFDKSTLIAHEVNGVRELDPIAVVSSFVDAEGRTVYDFGQNAGGYVAFTVSGEPGARVVVEHAEVLDHLGQFDRASMRSAEARAEYVLKGGGDEAYRPIFSFFGFRYARVEITGTAKLTRIELIPISSAIQPTGTFSSSNPLVDRLVQNTIWSQRSNFIEVPTDCPQRDERLGWTGDAQVFASTACYLHESQGILRKYVRDMIADQRPDGAIPHVVPDPTRNHEDIIPGFYGSTGWGDAICVIPMALYAHYGDSDIVAEALPAMEKWNDFVWSISNGPIVHPAKPWGGRGFTFGDWLQPVDGKWPMQKPARTIGDDASATIYLYISSELTAQSARLCGNTALAERMEDRAATVKAAFGREFVTPSGRLVYDDHTSYALAILHDLIPADLVPAATEYFKSRIEWSDYKIGTGFIGTPALLPALIKIGAADMAAKVFLQENIPGWLYQVKTGATTIWERWDAIGEDGKAFDPQMNSYNHYAYGAVCQWLFESVAGFRPDLERPAFEHIIFEPTVLPALSPVSAAHDSRAGRIEAGWSVQRDLVTYQLTVPHGATGTLVMAPNYIDILIDGSPLASAGSGKARSPLAPGSHTVTFRISRP
ncbi:family 78 glycoside hydrolase catalytic domain [Roseovarius sp.]|uniref:family 78 glycoside hydrolase catalytic domain n=1 Tax=Roseovarius sp. TaxID=1486281 RepID=UPI003A9885FA